MPARAYEVRTAIDEYRRAQTVYAKSAGAARNEVRLSANDAGYDIGFQHIKVRSLGVRETPHEAAAREAAAFNQRYPVGTRVVLDAVIGQAEGSRCSVVREPGAYVAPSGHVLVKVPGDSYAIEAVHPIAEGC